MKIELNVNLKLANRKIGANPFYPLRHHDMNFENNIRMFNIKMPHCVRHDVFVSLEVSHKIRSHFDEGRNLLILIANEVQSAVVETIGVLENHFTAIPI